MTKAFAGRIEVDIRDSRAGLGAVRAAEGARGCAERRVHHARRRRLLRDERLRRPDRHAEHRPHRGGRGEVHAVPHHRAVLAHALVSAHRAQPHTQLDGVHHRGGVGFPAASGTIPPENGMLPEILGELGWNTYMVGKWHLCPTDEMNLASTRRNWPSGARLRAVVRLPGRRRRTSGIRSWSTTTTRWTSRSRRRRATTSPRTSPTRRSSSSATAKAVAPDKPFFLCGTTTASRST